MGFVNAGRRLASTFGSRSWWSSSSHPPRFIRVTTQSESVMRSHPVGWLAWNSGTSLAKNSWLSLMISRYVTSMSYLDWKASSVGRWPPFARSIYSGHWATVSWWPRGGSVLGAAAGACLPAHAADRGDLLAGGRRVGPDPSSRPDLPQGQSGEDRHGGATNDPEGGAAGQDGDQAGRRRECEQGVRREQEPGRDPRHEHNVLNS